MPRTFVWHPGKGPKTTPALKIKDGETVRIKQVRSGIGHEARMRATLEAMGLRNHQAVIERVLTPQLRGQIKHVRHLLEVTPAGESAAKQPNVKQPAAKRTASNKIPSTPSASKKQHETPSTPSASKKPKEEKANG
jgi:large subunit ribosomal protein L30